MSVEPLVHLLVPKEFRVWCRRNSPIGDFSITNLPSKATCANCLTAMRTATGGSRSPFRVTHTGRELEPDPFSAWKQRQIDHAD